MPVFLRYGVRYYPNLFTSTNPTTGRLLLAICLLLTWLRDGAAFGSLLGVFLFTTTGLLIAFTLAWRRAWLRRLAMFAQSPARRSGL